MQGRGERVHMPTRENVMRAYACKGGKECAHMHVRKERNARKCVLGMKVMRAYACKGRKECAHMHEKRKEERIGYLFCDGCHAVARGAHQSRALSAQRIRDAAVRLKPALCRRWD